jgi:hypothetical protein
MLTEQGEVLLQAEAAGLSLLIVHPLKEVDAARDDVGGIGSGADGVGQGRKMTLPSGAMPAPSGQALPLVTRAAMSMAAVVLPQSGRPVNSTTLRAMRSGHRHWTGCGMTSESRPSFRLRRLILVVGSICCTGTSCSSFNTEPAGSGSGIRFVSNGRQFDCGL